MRALVVTLALLFLAYPAAADHCTTYSTTTTDHDTIVVEAAGFYVVNDVCQFDGRCFFSLWIYPETNGIPGLQRGDEVHDDTCHGMIEPDGIIF